MAGGTSLTKKQLAKIVSSARAAAEKNNQLIYAADDALEASQQELGKDAVKVSTLSTAHHMGNTFKTLIDVAASDKSKSTQAALLAAQAAAKKNREEMDNAANIMRESEALLGKDAVSLPSLGDPKGGPSPLFKAVLNGVARTKAAARHMSAQEVDDGQGAGGGVGRGGARGGARGGSGGVSGMLGQSAAPHYNFWANRAFLHATSMARMLP
jgi:hypothetical protein